ncbi:hypothetical protein EC968_001265 [Mortierella alpina]|nr:hypothetical protein EC968_001265 [Mortierella alpina]
MYIQSTFDNDVKVQEHQETLSQFDFMPIFLAGNDEADESGGGPPTLHPDFLFPLPAGDKDANKKDTDKKNEGETDAGEKDAGEKGPDGEDADNGETDETYCDSIKSKILETSEKFKMAIDNCPKDSPTGLQIVLAGLKCAHAELAKQVEEHLRTISTTALKFLVEAVTSVLGTTDLADKKDVSNQLITVLDECYDLLDKLEQCHKDDAKKAGNSKLEIPSAHQCTLIRDAHLAMLADAIARSPHVPEWASEELRRAVEGADLVMQVMRISFPHSSQSMTHRPYLIPTDWLNQYRIGIAHLAADENEDLLNYANGLAPIVSWSNALTACLAVSNDPVGSAESLAEHLRASESLE